METGGRPIPVVFIFLLMSISIFGVFTLSSSEVKFTKHSRASHAGLVKYIDKCFDGEGDISPTYLMDNGRYSQNCKDKNGNLYWRIYECTSKGEVLVISQFKHDWRGMLQRVLNYMSNHNMKEANIPCYRAQ